MCLYVSHGKTEQKLAEPPPASPHMFYKVFVKTDTHLISPYWSFKIDRPGRIYIPHPAILDGQEMIGKGAFHARTHEGALKQDAFYCEFFDRGEPVEIIIHALQEDIIAYGVQDDVALKGFIISFTSWYSIF